MWTVLDGFICHYSLEECHVKLVLCRPFCLPCFMVGLISLTAALSSIFFVEETLPAIAAKRYAALSGTEEEAKAAVHQMPGQDPRSLFFHSGYMSCLGQTVSFVKVPDKISSPTPIVRY